MLLKNKKGAALVEFALLLPLLLLLVAGSIEFGLIFYNKQVITNASREGARAGITPNPDGTINQALIKNTVKAYCNNGGGEDAWKIKSLYSPYYIAVGDENILDATLDENNDLTVTVTLIYPLYFAQFVGINNTNISARTVMRMEPVL